MQKIIVISGPTASGKSRLALDLARNFLTQDRQSVIINADSMQVYREIPVITAQPTTEEKKAVPHKLYGCYSASERCSAGHWAEMAYDEIERAFANKLIPILVGGTGMYIKTLMHGIAPIPEIDESLRRRVQKLFDSLGKEHFYEELLAIDPLIKNNIEKDNPQRLMRAREVVEQTGISITKLQKSENKNFFAADMFDCYFLNPPREKIYDKVNKRFEQMAVNGALEEAKLLKEMHLYDTLPAMRAHGVPELIKYLNDEITLAEAIKKAQRNTRNYVKRQITWFRHQMPEFKELNAADPTLLLVA